MWSFVVSKTNKQWIWIALDGATKQVIAFLPVIVRPPSPENCGDAFRKFIVTTQLSKSGHPRLGHPTAEYAKVRGEKPVLIVLCALCVWNICTNVMCSDLDGWLGHL
jgi:hypothetical protein